MAIFDGFFDQAFRGLTNPKGNLGDWRHASRLFVDNNFQYAPHSKFLYHVGFFLTPAAQSFTENIFKPYENVVGMLVRTADLPGFSVNLETKNKYNRKKNIQTNIEYEPISIEFYDDNFGLITALMEAYYRYYYADANTAGETGQGPYGTANGDTLYKDAQANNHAFGLDNRVPPVPFFDKIEITQMQRRRYTTFRLIRPILSSWNHDSVDASDTNTPMANSITVNYDTVVYERGDVETGSNGSPTTFGQEKYDKIPSPISTLGGAAGGLREVVGGVGDIAGRRTGGLLGTAIAGVNVFETATNLTQEGLREEGLNIATQASGFLATQVSDNIATGRETNFNLGSILGSGSSGDNLQIVFPKTLGNAQENTQTIAQSRPTSSAGGPGAGSAAAAEQAAADAALASSGGPGIDTPGGFVGPEAPTAIAQPADITTPDFEAEDLPPIE